MPPSQISLARLWLLKFLVQNRAFAKSLNPEVILKFCVKPGCQLLIFWGVLIAEKIRAERIRHQCRFRPNMHVFKRLDLVGHHATALVLCIPPYTLCRDEEQSDSSPTSPRFQWPARRQPDAQLTGTAFGLLT